MIPLYSLATSDMGNVMKILLIACAVLALIGFFVGFAKGFRQIGWKGVACFVALCIFTVFITLLEQMSFALNTDILQEYGTDRDAWTVVAVLFLSVGVALVLYALCTKMFRPYSKWVTSNPTYVEKGWEYEDDTAEEKGEVQGRLVWKHAGKPTLYGRFIGGLLGAVNVASALLVLLCIVFIAATKIPFLANMEMVSTLMSQAEAQAMYPYFAKYGVDFLCICILFRIACRGYHRGFLYSLFLLIKVLGGIALAALAFYIPFSPWIEEGGMLAMLAPYVGMLGSWVAAIPFVGTMAGVVTIVGKVLLGIILCVIFLVIFLILKTLLRNATVAVSNNGVATTVDGVFATLLYFIIGVAICFVIWAALYACTHYGWYDFSSFFEPGTFGAHWYEICQMFIEPLLETIVL